MKIVQFIASLSIMFILAACGGGEDKDAGKEVEATSPGQTASSSAAAKPDVASLRAAAKEVGTRFAAQDFAGYYDLWTAAAQAETTREKYAAAAGACEVQGGAQTTIDSARIEPDGSGVVIVSVVGLSVTNRYLFEDGEWRLDADRERLKSVLAGDC